eukprot:3140835-Alexandrium_andersonii.AAC.1
MAGRPLPGRGVSSTPSTRGLTPPNLPTSHTAVALMDSAAEIHHRLGQTLAALAMRSFAPDTQRGGIPGRGVDVATHV